MSVGAIVSFACGALGPISLACACVAELLARRIGKNPRCDKKRLAGLRHAADVALVAAWLLLAASYLAFQWISPDARILSDSFQLWMTWMLGAMLVLDILYLWLRKGRPRANGNKKHFWEM